MKAPATGATRRSTASACSPAYEWVLGSDFGISTTQNLSEAGFAPMQSLGTSNVIFNYADAGAGGATRGPGLSVDGAALRPADL